MGKKKRNSWDGCDDCSNSITTDNGLTCIFNGPCDNYSAYSPKIIGKKKDQGKLPWHLIPFEVVEKVVEILQYGAEKYGENTWQNLPDFNNRYFSALMRHLVAWKTGEKIDKESGKHHLAHALCNLVFLLWGELTIRREKKHGEG